MFREAGLGLLIGKRSWDGVIGIGNRGTLIDVDPDIEVENDPKSEIEGGTRSSNGRSPR